MGQYIGQVRTHKGISLEHLAHGLCSTAHLCRIETGKREANKLLTDALLQRLGSPAELFVRLLDWREFHRWRQRQHILVLLRKGDCPAAQEAVKAYHPKDVLEQQFLQTVTVNIRALQGASAAELRDLTLSALRLTQISFREKDIAGMLLSQNEGYLLLAYLEQTERLQGLESVAEAYRALLHLLKQEYYDARERVYLLPYVACHIIEADYRQGRLASALSLCEDTLEELSQERRLYAYAALLEWKQRLFDAIGKGDDRTPEKLLDWLRILQSQPPMQHLLIPYVERGHICCLNHVIRERRKLLGMSQEELAADICDVSTLSRIENRNCSLQKRIRQDLLRKVHMSGERYDYEIISERYEDYILRSEIARAVMANKYEEALLLLNELRRHIPKTETNQQYLDMEEASIRACISKHRREWLSPDEELSFLEDALHKTIPLEIEKIDEWPVSALSITEILLLLRIARHHKTHKKSETGLHVAEYALKCFENTNWGDTCWNEDLFGLIGLQVISCLGSSGYYEISNQMIRTCLKSELKNSRNVTAAALLYNLAWNAEHQLNITLQNTIFLFRLAYTATLLSGDVVGQRHIQKHCLDTFGIEILL